MTLVLYDDVYACRFNVWDTSRHSLPEEKRRLASVTALKVDSDGLNMITGSSIGYIQVKRHNGGFYYTFVCVHADITCICGNLLILGVQIWVIADYCVGVTEKPVTVPPPLQLAWKGHLSSIVSIDIAEERSLIISASTDCCVRLWTTTGRFIGER